MDAFWISTALLLMLVPWSLHVHQVVSLHRLLWHKASLCRASAVGFSGYSCLSLDQESSRLVPLGPVTGAGAAPYLAGAGHPLGLGLFLDLGPSCVDGGHPPDGTLV